MVVLFFIGCKQPAPVGPKPTPEPCAPTSPTDRPSATPFKDPFPWEVHTLYTAPAGRILFDVGVVAEESQSWVVWSDGATDQTDVRTRIAHFDGTVLEPVQDIGAVLDGSGTLPAIALSDGVVSVAALTDCDERWSVCDEDRQVELLSQDTSGEWSGEAIDHDNDGLDHGRTNLAFHTLPSGERALHACYKVLYEDASEDEVHCSIRSPDGVWGPSLPISDANEGADDHPTIAVYPDGLRVIGYSRKEGDRRRAALWLEQSPGAGEILTLDLSTGVGEDPLPGIDLDGVLHVIWREEIGDDFALVYGRCVETCNTLDSWTFHALTGSVGVDSPSLAMDGSIVIFTWTEGADVRVGWRCPSGLFAYSDPDPSFGEESMHRGQPSISIDEATNTMSVAYSKLTAFGTTEVRWARRSLPTCGASASSPGHLGW